MKSPSGATLTVLQHLRVSSAYTTELVDAIIVGRPSTRANALRLIHAAILELQGRVEAALASLESDLL